MIYTGGEDIVSTLGGMQIYIRGKLSTPW